MLRLVLRCFSKDLTFSQLAAESLRFHLNGQSQHVYALYELLMNNVLAIAVATSPRDRAARRAPGRERPPGGLRPRRGDAAVHGPVDVRLPAADASTSPSRRSSSSSTWAGSGRRS